MQFIFCTLHVSSTSLQEAFNPVMVRKFSVFWTQAVQNLGCPLKVDDLKPIKGSDHCLLTRLLPRCPTSSSSSITYYMSIHSPSNYFVCVSLKYDSAYFVSTAIHIFSSSVQHKHTVRVLCVMACIIHIHFTQCDSSRVTTLTPSAAVVVWFGDPCELRECYSMIENFSISVIISLCCLDDYVFMMLLVRVDVLPSWCCMSV